MILWRRTTQRNPLCMFSARKRDSSCVTKASHHRRALSVVTVVAATDWVGLVVVQVRGAGAGTCNAHYLRFLNRTLCLPLVSGRARRRPRGRHGSESM